MLLHEVGDVRVRSGLAFVEAKGAIAIADMTVEKALHSRSVAGPDRLLIKEHPAKGGLGAVPAALVTCRRAVRVWVDPPHGPPVERVQDRSRVSRCSRPVASLDVLRPGLCPSAERGRGEPLAEPSGGHMSGLRAVGPHGMLDVGCLIPKSRVST